MHLRKEYGVTRPKSIHGKHVDSRRKGHKHRSSNSKLLKNADLAAL